MASNSGNKKEQAHRLIDELDPAQVSAVVPLLQFMLLDPVSRSLAAASLEDAQVSSEGAAALDQARDSLDRSQGVSHADVLREFGLSPR
ncbi:MAG: hypothetical protein WCA00_02325 [Candidatus Acidiferrales bacterium]